PGLRRGRLRPDRAAVQPGGLSLRPFRAVLQCRAGQNTKPSVEASSVAIVIPFEAIEERARERLGGAQALVQRLPIPKSADELRAVPDDRYLSDMPRPGRKGGESGMG